MDFLARARASSFSLNWDLKREIWGSRSYGAVLTIQGLSAKPTLLFKDFQQNQPYYSRTFSKTNLIIQGLSAKPTLLFKDFQQNQPYYSRTFSKTNLTILGLSAKPTLLFKAWNEIITAHAITHFFVFFPQGMIQLLRRARELSYHRRLTQLRTSHHVPVSPCAWWPAGVRIAPPGLQHPSASSAVPSRDHQHKRMNNDLHTRCLLYQRNPLSLQTSKPW